jgi:hypothetical protein
MKIGHNPPIPVEWLEEMSKTYKISFNDLLELFHQTGNDKERLTNFLKMKDQQNFKNFNNLKNENLPKLTIFKNGILVKNRFLDFSNEENLNILRMLEKNEFDYDLFVDLFAQDESGLTNGNMENIVVERIDQFYSDVGQFNDGKMKTKRVPTKNEEIENIKRLKRMSLETNSNTRSIYKFVIGKGKVLLDEPNLDIIDGSNNLNVLNSSVILNGAIAPNNSIVLGLNPEIKFKLVLKNKEFSLLADQNLRISDVLCYFQSIFKIKFSILLAGEILDENESVMILKYSVGDLI